nr:hypothetical protein [Mycoplasmopsis bovis]
MTRSGKRDNTIGSDKYETIIDKFKDQENETPYDYNKKIRKRSQFIRFNKVHRDYMELLNKDLANDPKNQNLILCPLLVLKRKAFHG